MNKQSVIKRLRELKQQLMHSYGVTKLGVFGSTVRGTATRQSDVDILIDFETGHETYNNFISVCDLLEKAFGNRKVDVVTRNGLSPFIGDLILKEVEYV